MSFPLYITREEILDVVKEEGCVEDRVFATMLDGYDIPNKDRVLKIMQELYKEAVERERNTD